MLPTTMAEMGRQAQEKLPQLTRPRQLFASQHVRQTCDETHQTQSSGSILKTSERISSLWEKLSSAGISTMNPNFQGSKLLCELLHLMFELMNQSIISFRTSHS